jgi:hypothetical protein
MQQLARHRPGRIFTIRHTTTTHNFTGSLKLPGMRNFYIFDYVYYLATLYLERQV